MTGMHNRLSVIVPGYNNPDERWVRCVRSVLAAVDSCDEVICVDDASKSRPKALDILAMEDDRIRVVYREGNGGLSVARNTALELATGEYVAFVDSDDEIRSDTFNCCFEKLEQTQSDICLYGVEVIWPQERLLKRDVPRNHYYGELTPFDVKELTELRLFNYACNKVYRRKFLLDQKLTFDSDGMPCEDVIFNLTCAMRGAAWCSVDYVGYVYYRTGGTLLSRYRKSNEKGLRMCSDLWRSWRLGTVDADKAFPNGVYAEMTDSQLTWAELANRWLPGSPFSLRERCRWIRENSGLLTGGGVWAKLLQCSPEAFVFAYSLRTFLRRHLYFCFVRRYFLKRTFHNVKESRECE